MAAPKTTFSTLIATAPRFVSRAEAEALDQAIRNRIADRAYQLYEASGYAPGHDREHWLQAEAEELRRGLEVRESGSWMAVNGSIPGVAAEDVEIYVDARRIIIRAKKHGSVLADGASLKEPETEILLGADLPAEVDPATAAASLKDGKLILMVKKRFPSVVQAIEFADRH
jgi:HSP20 family molecular chaperone IbpA